MFEKKNRLSWKKLKLDWPRGIIFLFTSRSEHVEKFIFLSIAENSENFPRILLGVKTSHKIENKIKSTWIAGL